MVVMKKIYTLPAHVLLVSGGREFTREDVAVIEAIMEEWDLYATRSAISRAVCEALGWYQPNGQPKEVACRQALMKLEEDGWIRLPAPRRRPSVFRAPRQPVLEAPPEEIRGSRGDLADLRLEPVDDDRQSRLWNDLMVRHHYLGYRRLAGAQMRYLATSEDRVLAAMGFSAAAWQVAVRDRWIGWSPAQREARLRWVVNQSRFLVLPWVHVRFLASSLLAMAVRRLPGDWALRYGYRPVLAETFVDPSRFRGTCYVAANWTRLGRTAGRGKPDRLGARRGTAKEVLVYPLTASWRAQLLAPLAPEEGNDA